MSQDAKHQVEQYLKHDRTLIGGRNLYNKLPNKSRALQNAIARFSNTPQNLDRLCYELAKAVGMEERILKMLTQNPVVPVEKIKVVSINVSDIDKAPTPEDLLLKFDPETANYNDAKDLVKTLDIKTENKKKDTIFAALTEARTKLVNTKLAELPQEVKASIKLRDQFPFLKEPGCPNELKILVADLITAYDNFKTNQPKLHDILGDTEAKALVTTVKDNYIENKMAYNELEHYGKTQSILGDHPLFKRLALKKEITELDTPTLTKKINSLKTNISRNKKAENNELVERDEDLLQHAEDELSKR